MTAADGLAAAVERLRNQVGHWTPARWAAGPAAQQVHALVQQLADLAAEAAGEKPRSVPRLAHDIALPDQLAVVAGDLLAAAPSDVVLAAATDAVRATAATLR